MEWVTKMSWITELHPVVLIVIVIILGLPYIFRKAISQKLLELDIIQIFISRKYKAEELKKHDFFMQIEKTLDEVNIHKFFTDKKFDPSKTKMSHDFLTFKLETMRMVFTEMLDTEDIDKMSETDLRMLVFNTIEKCNTTFSERVQQKWLKKGISPEDISYVLEKFDVFRYDMTKSMFQRLDYIMFSDYYNTNFQRLLSMCEIFSSMVAVLPKEFKETFEHLNGKFVNINY